ncbi:MAG: 50S ribosomal protein L17 [Candidatus Riflebacteria bacterium RBG_13_59_9]|nr:MAG: 50S ribosomal protein L17 [Candidatus Riflebacteria bacterium RBG_13_59_9]
MRHRKGVAKLGRPTDQRLAMLRGLVSALFMRGHVETTMARCKATQAIAERMITSAKRGTLSDLRLVARGVGGKRPFKVLMSKVVPAVKDRSSGYTRVVRVRRRRGDGSVVARLSIVGYPEESSD